MAPLVRNGGSRHTGQAALPHENIHTAWCKANGIVEQTYYKNLKKLRELELEKIPTSLVPIPEEKPAVFEKLEVQTPVPDTKAAVIIRLNGTTIEVREGTSQQTIQAVLLALQSLC